MVYVLKGTGLLALWATGELWAAGDCLLALAAVPTLVTMWIVTRRYAHRRAREGVKA